jgi:hypothetical protein
MTFEQTVKIPENRRLTIDIPREFPMGEAILVFMPKPAVPEDRTSVEAATKETIKTARNPATDSHFSGEALFEERRKDRIPNETPGGRLLLKGGKRLTPHEAIEKCNGIAKGILSSDEIIAMRREDKTLEDTRFRRLFQKKVGNVRGTIDRQRDRC